MATQQQNKTQTKGSGNKDALQANANLQNTNLQHEQQAQRDYWRQQYGNEPYYDAKQPFEAFEPAYSLGAQAREQHAGKDFDAVEAQLRKQYEAAAGASGKALDWQQARPAVRAAWDRADLAQANRENIPADGMRQPRH